MAFCTHCGHPLENDPAICPSCNAVIKPEENAVTPEVTTRASNKSKKKWKMIIAVLGAVLIIGVVVFYWYGKKETTPVNQLQAFEQALEAKDGKKMSKLLVPSTDSMTVTMETGDQLMDYLSKNPNVAEGMIDVFKDQIRTKGMTKMPEDYPQLLLKKSGKKLLFFDTYRFEVQPYYALISVNYKGTTIIIDDKEWGTTEKDNDEIKVGPLAPGVYTLIANYKGEYGKEEKEIELDFYQEGTTNANIEVEMSGSAVVVSSNYPDAFLYINGEDSGYSVDEYKELGTMKRDGSVTLQAYYDFGFSEGYSDEMTVTTQKTVNLNIEPDKDTAYEGIKTTLLSHTYQWIDAFEYQDMSSLTLVQDSDYIKNQEKNFKTLYNKNMYWEGTFNSLVFDLGFL